MAFSFLMAELLERNSTSCNIFVVQFMSFQKLQTQFVDDLQSGKATNMFLERPLKATRVQILVLVQPLLQNHL